MKSLERVQKVAQLFAAKIVVLDGVVAIGDPAELRRHWKHFEGDKTGLEAFVNHFHLEELLRRIVRPPLKRRPEALRLGEQLIRVWAERIAGIAGAEVSLLYYLGGSEDVVLRFHSERANEHPWMAIGKKGARSFRLRIFRSRGGEVSRLA